MSKIIALLLASIAVSTLAAQDSRPSSVDFAKDVWPIIEARCVECHGAPKKDARGRLRKPKGGLRLDGRHWITVGGNGGKVLVFGGAKASSLYSLVALPADDPDIMPAKGEPLKKSQIATIRRWIDEGAKFGAWTGAAGPVGGESSEKKAATTRRPSRIVQLENLARGVKPAASSAIAKARSVGVGGRIAPAWKGSPLLVVDWSRQETVDDKSLMALKPLAAHIVELRLGRTKITDRSLAVIAMMRRLTRLHLSGTSVTDQGLRALVALPELRKLVLFETPVTDKVVDAVARMKKLEAVHLAGTKVTKEGAIRLGALRPKLRVQHAVVFPKPAKDGDRPNRRRRRNK